MKLSQTPTNWLLIKAHTHSENYSVDFALVNLTDAAKRRLVDQKSCLDNIPSHLMPYTTTFWDSPDGWYNIDYDREEEEALEELLYSQGKEYSFLDATDEEIEKLTESESRLENGLIHFNRDGDFWFDADVKHTDIQFYTSHVKLKEIL